jgi:predicted amidohydrolase
VTDEKHKIVRFAGAQIPVTPDIKKNVETIKKAIDWASKNNVDYLITPEASLSGYGKNWCSDINLLFDSLQIIETYAAEKKVGLALGTLWIEQDPDEKGDRILEVKRNQVRFYKNDGVFVGAINKTVGTPHDVDLGIQESTILTGIILPIGDLFLPVGALICADMYGHASSRGGLFEKLARIGASLIIHPTNAERGSDKKRDEIEELWIESWIRRGSLQMKPVISVDNCFKMDGTEYHGKTLTKSGVCIDGVWEVTAPRTGTQYFYYDITVETVEIPPPESSST